MSKEKIEEMAKYLTHCFMNCAPCEKCRAYIYSEQLYNAGYRKQSGDIVEVVRCKDCALRYTGDCASMQEDDTDMYFRLCDDDEFCSSGVRKEADMSKEQMIEEIARDIFEPKVAIDGIDIAFAAVHGADRNSDTHFMRIARHLYSKGYRKQSEGEWKSGKTMNGAWGYSCSLCGAAFVGENAEWIAKEHNYCPKCGAKMKGGVE